MTIFWDGGMHKRVDGVITVTRNCAESHRQEWPTTFDGCIRFRRFLRRLKAETEGFPTPQKSSKTDITIESYGPSLSLNLRKISHHCNYVLKFGPLRDPNGIVTGTIRNGTSL